MTMMAFLMGSPRHPPSDVESMQCIRPEYTDSSQSAPHPSESPWIAATALLIICGLLLWWRWHARAWMKIDIFRHDRGAADASKMDADTERSAGLAEAAIEA